MAASCALSTSVVTNCENTCWWQMGGVGVFASVSACRAVPGAAAAVAASVVAGVTVVTAIVPRLGPPGRSEVRGTTSALHGEAAGNAETWADRAVCIGGGGGGGGEGGRVHAAAVSRSRGHDGGGAEGGVGSCMCKVREPEKASRRRPSQQQCCRCVAAGLRSVRPSGATISTQMRWEMRRQHTERNGH